MAEIRFIEIEDYTDISIWDRLILDEIPKLPTKPRGWPRPHAGPEGGWTLASGLYSLATDGAYQRSGIPKPTFEQLPAIFCLDGAKVEAEYNVTAEQAAAFIAARIVGGKGGA